MNENYTKIVRELNNKLYDTFGDDTWEFFSHTTTGFHDMIMYGDLHLWNSEEGERGNG